VYQVGPDSSGKWSGGSQFTPVLSNVTSLAAIPNGALLAVGADGIVRYSSTGQSGTWQDSISLAGGTYTIAVTPNGVVYILPHLGSYLMYSTTGLPSSWKQAQFYTPGYDGPPGQNVLGLANGRDGQVYFFAAGNVYQVLNDGIGSVVRAHINTQSWNQLASALTSGGVDLVAKTCNYLYGVDGTNQTTEAVLQSVAQAVHATFQKTGLVQVVYDGAKLGKEASELAKDVSDLAHDTNPALQAVDALKFGFDLVGDVNDDPSAQIVVNVVETVLNISAIAIAC
jgi:hypothetical protein